jgi:hypothetical protein
MIESSLTNTFGNSYFGDFVAFCIYKPRCYRCVFVLLIHVMIIPTIFFKDLKGKWIIWIKYFIYSFIIPMFTHICGVMITCVCDVWYIQISNYWIIKCKMCMWASIVMWLAHVLFSCHDTFAIFTHGAYTNCFNRCAYATYNLICFSFSHAYFLGEFYWCLNINYTYIKYMLLAHIDVRFVWNIHMPGIITYVGCTFTPHPNSKYFKYLNVRCTNFFYMLEDYHIAYVLESQWVVICLWYMILILIMFSHESVVLFG